LRGRGGILVSERKVDGLVAEGERDADQPCF
jgi:hypothetical protein